MARVRYAHLRMGEQERRALEELSRLEGTKLAETLRNALRYYAEKRGCWPPKGKEVER